MHATSPSSFRAFADHQIRGILRHLSIAPMGIAVTVSEVSKPEVHPHPRRHPKSANHPPNLLHLPHQPRDLPQDSLGSTNLAHHHVSALQSLRKHVHDLTSHVRDVGIADVDEGEHRVQPIEAGVDVGVEAAGYSG